MASKAVVVIDVQNCFLPGGSLGTSNARDKDFPAKKIYASECKIPKEELIYNWQNDINQDEIDQFKQDWEI